MVLDRGWTRWLTALGVFVGATWLNIYLQPLLQGRAPLLPYFPALVLVGLACGFGPALALVVGSCAAILYFWIAPVGEFFPINSFSDVALIALFFVAGLVVAGVSASAGSLMKKDRQSRRRLQLALAAGRMVTWDVDLAKGITTTTGAAQEMFGDRWTSVEELMQRMSPEDAAALKSRYEAALKHGGRFSQTAVITRRDDGKTVWAQIDGDVTTDAVGQPTHVYGAAVDISQLAEAQAQVRIESQRKDTFLATLAHELRNPLAPIRYAVASLRQAPAGKGQRALDIIDRQSAHMARLVDDLLDMSRITRNAVELRRELVDLKGIVKQALDTVEPLYVAGHHRVSLSMPSAPVLVDGDPARLQQVLGNLLDNAAKYSPEPGEVEVHLAVDAGYAKVTVTDTGVGIAKDLQSKVFELFSRLDSSNAAPAGLGIGLAVSLQLVHLHGGTLSVESEGTGRGSRFIVCLPLAEASVVNVAPETPVKHVPPAADAVSVLVVDDNVDGAESLAVLLELAEFSVATAHTGQEACEMYEQLRPGIVLLDIGLPDISGLEVARRLRATGSLSEVLCARHSMTTRSMNAKQDEVEERGDCREIGRAAEDSPRAA